LASTAYTPTAALRQQTVQGYANRLKTTNPAASQAVVSVFGPGKYDYNQTCREILKGTGLRENDATDALACCLLMSWLVVHSLQDDKAIAIPMAQGVGPGSAAAGQEAVLWLPKPFLR
jgi:predicted PhzF superfamily epimerase YddE/YHI9